MAAGEEWVGLISLFHRKNNSYRDQESAIAVHETHCLYLLQRVFMRVIIHKESSWTAEAKQPFVICLKMGQNNPYKKAINWLPAHLHLDGNVISLTNLLCHISLDNTDKKRLHHVICLISPLTFFLIMTSKEEWSVKGTATPFYLELVRTGYTFDLLNSPGYVCDLLQGC